MVQLCQMSWVGRIVGDVVQVKHLVAPARTTPATPGPVTCTDPQMMIQLMLAHLTCTISIMLCLGSIKIHITESLFNISDFFKLLSFIDSPLKVFKMCVCVCSSEQ